MPIYVGWLVAGLLVLLVTLPLLRIGRALLLIVYAPPIPAAPANTIRIACVGDSITYGVLVKDRSTNCYPARLQNALGAAFAVRNFGANGRAAQKDADLPYWKHPYFRKSSQFAPHIVLLMLGTNDSRKRNWHSVERYLQDYSALVAHYQALPSKPTVHVLTPPAQFVLPNQQKVKYTMVPGAVQQMTAGLKALANELGVEVIDINTVTQPHSEHFSYDGIHANAGGAQLIAATVSQALGRKLRLALKRNARPSTSII
jgi:lysophospholipase L1-like esterase